MLAGYPLRVVRWQGFLCGRKKETGFLWYHGGSQREVVWGRDLFLVRSSR